MVAFGMNRAKGFRQRGKAFEAIRGCALRGRGCSLLRPMCFRGNGMVQTRIGHKRNGAIVA